MPANFPPGYVPEGDTAPLQGGIPWEQKGGSFVAKWWNTLKACNSQPRPFFAAAAQNEKGDAILFAMVSGGVSGAFLGALYLVIMVMISAGVMLAMPSARGGHGGSGVAPGMFAAGFTVGFGILYAFMITVMSAIGAAARAFIWGGIHHIVLLLFGGIGAQKSFMHTIRAAAYAEGSALPWLWIPIAGPFIAAFYGIRNTVIGYDEAHRCGIGRALLALFSPAICCCGCMGLMAAMGAIPALMGP